MRQADGLHVAVDVEGGVELGQGNVVPEVGVVVLGVDEDLHQVPELLPG